MLGRSAGVCVQSRCPSFDQTPIDEQSAFKEKSVHICQISMFLWQSVLGVRLVS